jgi:hypothetical protein
VGEETESETDVEGTGVSGEDREKMPATGCAGASPALVGESRDDERERLRAAEAGTLNEVGASCLSDLRGIMSLLFLHFA